MDFPHLQWSGSARKRQLALIDAGVRHRVGEDEVVLAIRDRGAMDGLGRKANLDCPPILTLLLTD